MNEYHHGLDGYIYDFATQKFKKYISGDLTNNDFFIDGISDIEKEKLTIEEIDEDTRKKINEGALKHIWVNVYERNPKAKMACLEFYRKRDGGSIKCWVCHMDFGKDYDERMTGRIHVHHLVPLMLIKGDYIVDPIKDLIPICPNCHYVIHYLDLDPDELRTILDTKRITNKA